VPVKVFHDDKATLRVEVRKEEGPAAESEPGEASEETRG